MRTIVVSDLHLGSSRHADLLRRPDLRAPLLEAVAEAAESTALWVADPNPRAQAFYRKHGFVADGTTQVEDGVREIRMVRGVQRGR